MKASEVRKLCEQSASIQFEHQPGANGALGAIVSVILDADEARMAQRWMVRHSQTDDVGCFECNALMKDPAFRGLLMRQPTRATNAELDEYERKFSARAQEEWKKLQAAEIVPG